MDATDAKAAGGSEGPGDGVGAVDAPQWTRVEPEQGDRFRLDVSPRRWRCARCGLEASTSEVYELGGGSAGADLLGRLYHGPRKPRCGPMEPVDAEAP